MHAPQQTHRFLTSFRGRLTLWFGGLTFATLLVVGVYVGQIAAGEIAKTSGEKLFLAAKSAADLITANLRERTQEVDLLRRSPALTQGNLTGPELQELLDYRKSVHSEFAWIGITDPEGKVIRGTGGLLVGENVEHRPWFKGALDYDLLVGDLHEAALLAKRLPQVKPGEPLRFIDFAAPIRDESGKLRGVLGTHVHWWWITETVESVITEQAAKQDVDVLIINKDDKVIYPQELVDLKVPAHLAVDKHYVMTEWTDGMFLTSVSTVRDQSPTKLQWRIVLRQPLGTAEALIHDLWQQLVLSGIGASLLIALLGFRFASRISRPIEQLATAVDQVATQGEQPSYPPPQNIPELDKLTDSIKSTTASLLQREEELQALNASLEQQVAERTEALTIANRELEQLSISDALTGVNNRRRFDEKLREYFAMEKRNGAAYSLLVVDVDHFKNINDTYGHPTGDSVLQQLASLLKNNVRESDFVARYGGEEFVVLLYNINGITDGCSVADKLRTAVANHSFATVGKVTISVGLSQSSPVDANESMIVQRADAALYAAKRNGRNRVEVISP